MTLMNLTEDERIRCEECLEKLYQTKLLCMQSIEYLLEQQNEIDECMSDLKSTKIHAEEINKNISELDRISWFFFRKQKIFESNLNEQNPLLILPFPNQPTEKINDTYGLMELEKLVDSMQNFHSDYSTKEEFERILHDEYTMLFELAKKLTKCVQILHDTIEFLGNDIKLTLDYMQAAQPRMKQLLQTRAPFAFAQAQQNSLV